MHKSPILPLLALTTALGTAAQAGDPFRRPLRSMLKDRPPSGLALSDPGSSLSPQLSPRADGGRGGRMVSPLSPAKAEGKGCGAKPAPASTAPRSPRPACAPDLRRRTPRPRRPGAPGAGGAVNARPCPSRARPSGRTRPRTWGRSRSASRRRLLGAVTSNPDLVTLRNSNVASPEAVEVARRFPTTLNPTLWVDFRPITLIPPDTFGNSGGRRTGTGPFYHFGKSYYYISYRQPIELGHQTTHRYHIAQAALEPAAVDRVAGRADRRSSRPTASSRRRPTAARSSGWPSELADFNDRLAADAQARARGQPGRRRRRHAGRGREPGDPPAGRGREAGLRQRPDRPAQPDRRPRVGRHRRAARRVHPAAEHPARSRTRP